MGAKRDPKKPWPKHGAFLKAALLYLNKLTNAYFFPVSQGPYSRKGISDIIGCYCGRFVAIELKTARDRATPLQEAFQARCHLADGLAFVAWTMDDISNRLKTLAPDNEEHFNF